MGGDPTNGMCHKAQKTLHSHRQAVDCDMNDRVTSLGLYFYGGTAIAIFSNVYI